MSSEGYGAGGEHSQQRWQYVQRAKVRRKLTNEEGAEGEEDSSLVRDWWGWWGRGPKSCRTWKALLKTYVFILRHLRKMQWSDRFLRAHSGCCIQNGSGEETPWGLFHYLEEKEWLIELGILEIEVAEFTFLEQNLGDYLIMDFEWRGYRVDFLVQFSSVQSLSCVRLFATPWTAAYQGSLPITDSRSLPKPMSIESVMPSNHFILCRPFFLPPLIFPSIRVFSNESALCIRWPKYWSFSFSISPSSEHPGLTSFRTDWLDLLAVQGTLKSLLQHHSSKTFSG